MNVVERRRMRQPSGGADVLVVVPGDAASSWVSWIDEDVVLHAGRGVAVELDDGYVADVLAGRGALQERREVVERVRRAERVVLAVGA